MRTLRLYPDGLPPPAAVEEVEGRERDPTCELCPHGKRALAVCMAAERVPSSFPDGPPLLVIAAYPGPAEDRCGRPQVGPAGLFLRRLLRRAWRGPVVFDNAIKCYPAGESIQAGQVAKCRPYLNRVVRDVAPARVLSMGGPAAVGLFGRSVPVTSCRKGFGWLRDGNIPVFFLPNAAFSVRNPFEKTDFIEDLEWALEQPANHLRGLMPWTTASTVRVVDTVEDALEAERDLRDADWVSYDGEWAGDMYGGDFEILTVGLCAKYADDAWAWSLKALRDPAALEVLHRLLRSPCVYKCAQSGKNDQLAIWAAWGFPVRGTLLDTRLTRQLENPGGATRLEVQQNLVGMGGGKDEVSAAMKAAYKAIVPKKPSKKDAGALRLFDDSSEVRSHARRYDVPESWVRGVREIVPRRKNDSLYEAAKKYLHGFVPEETLLRYCGVDALSTARLGERTEDVIFAEEENAPIRREWEQLLMPAVEAFAQVEQWGIRVDRTSLDSLRKLHESRRDRALRRFREFEDEGVFTKDGEPCAFNPDNNNHKRALLYDHLRFKPPFRTEKGSPSVNKEALERLKRKHSIAKDIQDLAAAVKNVQDLARLQRSVDPDGRIHTSFNLDGTETGRLSTHPNLQNITKDLRNVFIADAGCALFEWDYATLELRVLAGLSGDPVMRQTFIEGRDLHTETAILLAPIVSIDPEEVRTHKARTGKNHPLRDKAKTINFGLAYGKGTATLADEMGIDIDAARELVAAILGLFKRMDRWRKNRRRSCRREGGVYTYWNGERARFRPLRKIASRDEGERGGAERAAVNTPVQGSAAYFALASVNAIVRWILEEGLDRQGVRVVLTVHDSIMLEVPFHLATYVYPRVKAIMSSWFCWDVPLIVDCKAGHAWGSCSDVVERDGELVALVEREDEVEEVLIERFLCRAA